MNPDIYGRLIIKSLDQSEEDCYQIDDETGNGSDGTMFNLCVPVGTNLTQVYSTINAMAPVWYIAPQDS